MTTRSTNPADSAKHARISAAILAKIAEGMNGQEALDAVLGEGTYKALVSNLYDALRAKAQVSP